MSSPQGFCRSLHEEFLIYFPKTSDDTTVKMIRNPVSVSVKDVETESQEEIIDLRSDGDCKELFQNISLEEFWTNHVPCSSIQRVAINYLVQFSTTYLCKKNKQRNRLDVSADKGGSDFDRTTVQ